MQALANTNVNCVCETVTDRVKAKSAIIGGTMVTKTGYTQLRMKLFYLFYAK